MNGVEQGKRKGEGGLSNSWASHFAGSQKKGGDNHFSPPIPKVHVQEKLQYYKPSGKEE